MIKYVYSFALTLLFYCSTGALQPLQAQDPITEVIRAAVTKAIVAMDLQVQRLQNETIWLQNAQKVLENKLSELKLAEIAAWSEAQRQLYAGYYEELWQVKTALTHYRRVRDMLERQTALVAEYQRAYRLFQQDGHFTAEELAFMQQVYRGILAGSVQHLDQLLLVLRPGTMQMRDAQRLALLEEAAAQLDANYSDLRAFNAENIRLSLQRAKDQQSLQRVQRLYGLPSSN
ncbi:conjugal transfer protein TraI [Pontibacter indicus]|uniref:Conjugal transfer protein TraI n=1 Tax=Pontibacter indicus TaxID=1317125 RepID=A0A1R3XTU8_9BACT|nr:conjugal transfer protein TraI [Pontibacter indicus]SIT95224.1 hypothetical protein SAMN05444128_3971 [Pontibacter indicus]